MNPREPLTIALHLHPSRPPKGAVKVREGVKGRGLDESGQITRNQYQKLGGHQPMTKRQDRQAQRIAQAVAAELAPRLADLDRRVCALEARVGHIEDTRP